MTTDNNLGLTRITKNVSQASVWLKTGNLLAYPTESVWGIGCDAHNQHAVKQILAIKNRSISKGLIVVTHSSDVLVPLLTHLTPSQRENVLESWQHTKVNVNRQAQTWLLPLPNNPSNNVAIPDWITGQHESVAVRVIAHPLVSRLCASMVSRRNPYGFIVSTSCNPSGYPPATNFNDAYAYFGKNETVAYLQGGTLGYALPSQIRDATTGKIVR